MENRIGFGKRLGAYLLDFVIVGALGALASGVVDNLFPGAVERALAEQMSDPRMRDPKVAEGAAGMMSFMSWVVRWSIAMGFISLLYGLCEALRGWSPAKLALGLRIADEAGNPAPVGTLLIRYLIKYSGTVVAVAGVLTGISTLDKVGQMIGIGIVLGFFLVLTSARQALHDKIAGTVVVKVARAGQPVAHAA